jgi:hypothetical protein
MTKEEDLEENLEQFLSNKRSINDVDTFVYFIFLM